MRQEWDAIEALLAALPREGRAPADPDVQAAVEDHRRHIDRWFYPCSRAMHRALGETYVANRASPGASRGSPSAARRPRGGEG